MKRSETYVLASIAALALALPTGCFSADAVTPLGENDAATPDDATSSSDSSSGSSSPDATIEAGPDASSAVDAEEEASAEAGADAPIEAGVDASVVDAAIEAGPEAGVDASVVDAASEAGPEAGVDASVVDAASEAGPDAAGTVVIGTTNTQVIAVADTATLFIYDNHAVWAYGSATQVSYQNLPAALAGTVGNDTVNTSTPVTFTLTATTTCYLIRQDNWTSVDLTGWVAFDHNAYYFSGYDNGGYGPGTIYKQTFPAGVYKWNTYSAMYACAE